MEHLIIAKLKMTAVAMLVLREGSLEKLNKLLQDEPLTDKKLLTAYYHEIKNHVSTQTCVG